MKTAEELAEQERLMKEIQQRNSMVVPKAKATNDVTVYQQQDRLWNSIHQQPNTGSSMVPSSASYPSTMTVYDEAANNGKLVHVPMHSMLIQPCTSLHGGGIRTGPSGNPRGHAVIYFIPKEHERTCLGKDSTFFQEGFVSDWWIGDDEDKNGGRCRAVRGGIP